MAEIIDSITYEIENSGYSEKLGAGVIITGGGALLKHLRQLMSYKTSQDVNIGYPNKSLVIEDNEINLPIFSTSIGLLLTGYKHSIENNSLQKLENEEELDENEDADIKDVPEEKQEKIIDLIKDKFQSLFDDKGSKM